MIRWLGRQTSGPRSGDAVKKFALAFAVLGLVCVAFGWWGVKTRAGSRMFEEMAGMIPFFVGVFGAVLVVVGAGLYVWQRFRA